MSIQNKLRVNEQIRSKTVRLVAEDGGQVGVIPVEEALVRAQQERLDLVEVAPNAVPPVCKIMDYGKFRYRLSKRLHQGKHHISKLKELQLAPKIAEHDIKVRIKRARQFLQRRDKVIVNVFFRGLEMRHTEVGEQLLQRFMTELEDIAKAEKPPQLEGRKMSMILVAK